MKVYSHFIYIIPSAFILTSCNNISNKLSTIGPIGLTIFFAILMLSMIGMFFYVVKKKKEAEQTATGFSHQVRAMVNKIEGKENKIKALEILLERIYKDEKYKKNPSWRDKILSKVYQEMGAVYYQANESDKLLEICNKVIELEPDHMLSYYNRGTLYGNLGIYDKALKDLANAITLDDTYTNTYNNRGLIYEKMGRYEEAIADYDFALTLEETPIIYYNRGNAYARLNEIEKAKTDYQKALSIGTGNNINLEKEIETSLRTAENRTK